MNTIAPPAPAAEATNDQERISLFQRIADKVSYGMGTPTNIIIWILAVGTWIALGPYFATHSFLPGCTANDTVRMLIMHRGRPYSLLL